MNDIVMGKDGALYVTDTGFDTKRNNVAVPYVALNRVDIIQLEE